MQCVAAAAVRPLRQCQATSQRYCSCLKAAASFMESRVLATLRCLFIAIAGPPAPVATTSPTGAPVAPRYVVNNPHFANYASIRPREGPGFRREDRLNGIYVVSPRQPCHLASPATRAWKARYRREGEECLFFALAGVWAYWGLAPIEMKVPGAARTPPGHPGRRKSLWHLQARPEGRCAGRFSSAQSLRC
jgi:hypothetical protein